MAGKFLTPEEAARHLGVTVDEINHLVDRRKLYPIRDGATMKFKFEEIERVAADMGDESSGGAAGSDLALDLSSPSLGGGDAAGGGGDDLVIGGPIEPAESIFGDKPAGSDDLVIGDAGSALASSDFDIEAISGMSSPSVARGDKGPASGVGSAVAGGSGGLSIDLGSGPIGGLSAATPAPLSGPIGESGLSLEGDLAAASGPKLGGSGLNAASGLDLDLGGSGIQVGGSGLQLGGSGIDVAASGPNLAASGIDVGGSIAGSGIGDLGGGGGDAFDLGGGIADEDSGSVVIATEESGDSSFFGAAIDDSSSMSIDGMDGAAVLAPSGDDFLQSAAGPPFSVLQIVGLVCCTLFLLTCSFVMIDLVWSIRAPAGTPMSSPLLKALTDLFGWR